MPTNSWMDKKVLVDSHHGTVHSNENEWSAMTHDNLSECTNIILNESQEPTSTYFMFHFSKV